MIRRPPRSTRTDTLFPYTTLFRSVLAQTTDKLAQHTLPYRQFQLRRDGRTLANHLDHGRILEAILAGDEARAYECMRRHVTVQGDVRSEERRVGKEGVRTCRSGWSPYH